MPPKVSVGPEEDVRFLLTIIKQLNGTPDWQKVTDELELPSKGAAAKRFSRLPEKYSITMPPKGKASSATPDAETPKKKKGKAAAKDGTASAKKRKLKETEDEDVKEEQED